MWSTLHSRMLDMVHSQSSFRLSPLAYLVGLIHLHTAHDYGNCRSAADIVFYEKWERSNRLSVMFIKTKISDSIRGYVNQLDSVRDLLKGIDEQFVTSEKVLASTLIMKLSSQRLTSVKGVNISESFLDKWSINKLMIMCVQKKGRLLMEQSDSIQANQGKGKIPPKADIKKESKCFFCKKKGHMKKDCVKFKKWLEDKSNQISFVCYESNMVNISINTWWIDSSSTIHISNSLQGLQNLRKPVGSQQSIFSGNKMGLHVEAIGTCYLTLSSGFVLELDKTFYVPSFSRKLISVSRLVPFGYSFNFSETSFSLFYKSDYVGNGTLSDSLYCINLQNNATYNSMHVQTSSKRCVIDEDSSTLWHRRLCHISIERIKILVNDEVLSTLNFTDFETCMDCIKEKQTNKLKKGANSSSDILEIIHTDVCCPDMDSYGQKYFIFFIYDYSRYMYLYLLHNKNEALDAFKIFKAKVEKQCDKQIKIVKSDRGR
ncbi:hypothetical protein ACOSP7_012630 [Xanthoceras sorbifolium]